jgi:hypothetical protein
VFGDVWVSPLLLVSALNQADATSPSTKYGTQEPAITHEAWISSSAVYDTLLLCTDLNFGTSQNVFSLHFVLQDYYHSKLHLPIKYYFLRKRFNIVVPVVVVVLVVVVIFGAAPGKCLCKLLKESFKFHGIYKYVLCLC